MKKETIICDKCHKEFEEKTSIYATVFINSNECVNDRCDICLEPTYKECSVCSAEKYCNYSVLVEVNENDRA